jgi:flavodoxin
MKSTAIVYYSLSGNTKYAAEALAEQIDAVLIRLDDKTSRRGVIGFLRNGLQARLEKSTKLSGRPWEKIESCDTVYVMTPLWANRPTPAMNAFIDHANLNGKTVKIVTFQGDPTATGSGAAIEALAKRVEMRGGTVDQTFALHSAPPGRFAGDSHLSGQVSRLQ